MEKRRKREEKMAERMMRKAEKKEMKEAEERGEITPRSASLEDAPTAMEYLEGPLVEEEPADEGETDERPR